MAHRIALSVVSLCIVASCTFGTSPEPVRQHIITGMKYRVLVRDKDGKYRLGSPAESGDVKVYVFSVRVSDLRQFGQDDLRAARELLEKTQSVPGECQSRYRVTEIGRIEGGIRTISVECGEGQ